VRNPLGVEEERQGQEGDLSGVMSALVLPLNLEIKRHASSPTRAVLGLEVKCNLPASTLSSSPFTGSPRNVSTPSDTTSA
jgi:hypothetical protein